MKGILGRTSSVQQTKQTNNSFLSLSATPWWYNSKVKEILARNPCVPCKLYNRLFFYILRAIFQRFCVICMTLHYLYWQGYQFIQCSSQIAANGIFFLLSSTVLELDGAIQELGLFFDRSPFVIIFFKGFFYGIIQSEMMFLFQQNP